MFGRRLWDGSLMSLYKEKEKATCLTYISWHMLFHCSFKVVDEALIYSQNQVQNGSKSDCLNLAFWAWQLWFVCILWCSENLVITSSKQSTFQSTFLLCSYCMISLHSDVTTIPKSCERVPMVGALYKSAKEEGGLSLKCLFNYEKAPISCFQWLGTFKHKQWSWQWLQSQVLTAITVWTCSVNMV